MTEAFQVDRIKFETKCPSFSVAEFIDVIKERGYTNNYMYFNFDELLEDLPKINRTFHNDIIAKAILAHSYGEMLSKTFREWIRSQMREEDELVCGGSTIGVDEGGLPD